MVKKTVKKAAAKPAAKKTVKKTAVKKAVLKKPAKYIYSFGAGRAEGNGKMKEYWAVRAPIWPKWPDC